MSEAETPHPDDLANFPIVLRNGLPSSTCTTSGGLAPRLTGPDALKKLHDLCHEARSEGRYCLITPTGELYIESPDKLISVLMRLLSKRPLQQPGGAR